MTDPAARDLPTVVIGGYLGAGKTTLVNHLLRHAAGRRVAVLVNDFGVANIDAELIEDAAGATAAGVISLAGGCLCCSFGDDLVGTLAALTKRELAPDVVLIELSGLALPAAVVRSVRLAPGIAVVGALCVADAAELRRQAADRYVGDTVRRQLLESDWVLLNKPDLVDAQALQATASWIGELAPRSRVLACAAAQMPAELVLGWQGEPERGDEVTAQSFAQRPLATARHIGAGMFVSFTLPLPAHIDFEALAARLACAGSGVLRAKGLGTDAAGAGRLLQVCGARWSVTAAPARGPGRLVLIGLRDALVNPCRLLTSGDPPPCGAGRTE